MVNIKDMIRQADDLHKWADHEADPKIRDRLNRMAEAYVHIAETEAAAQPASVHGMMDVLTHGGESGMLPEKKCVQLRHRPARNLRRRQMSRGSGRSKKNRRRVSRPISNCRRKRMEAYQSSGWSSSVDGSHSTETISPPP